MIVIGGQLSSYASRETVILFRAHVVVFAASRLRLKWKCMGLTVFHILFERRQSCVVFNILFEWYLTYCLRGSRYLTYCLSAVFNILFEAVCQRRQSCFLSAVNIGDPLP